ncbi:MAG: hypothetical protein D6705_10605 [Deltaproteobacteria bacterium]|nr:MAG: hypothetical protein D6705_10605 [Deltaproteobacteria bacterium]
MITSLGCAPKKKDAPRPTSPEAAPTADDHADAAPLSVEHPVAWTDVDVRIENLDAHLQTWSKLSVWWEKPPAAPPDARAEFESLLLGLGAGPSLPASIDYKGAHEVVFSYPQPDQRAVASEKYRLAGRLAVTDVAGFLEGLPPSLAPRPLGGGLWELAIDQDRLLLREQAGALEVGASERDLERAHDLPHPADPPYRFVASISGLAEADVDPGPLFGLPEGDPRAERLADVVRGIERMALAADFGPDRDLRLAFTVDAPVEKLGLEPLGAPLTAPGPVEAAFPAEPLLVVETSLRDAKPAFEMLRKGLPVDEIPDPFGALLRSGLDHLGRIVELSTDRGLGAMFLDERGNSTLLLAARVRDAAAAGRSARGLLETLESAAKAQNDLVGNDPKAKFRAKLARGGWTVGSTKADVLTITPPKDADVEHTPISTYFDRSRFHVAAWVQDEHVFVVMGAGARKIATGLARNLGRSDRQPWASLELARAEGGCQVCLGLEGNGIMRLLLAITAGDTKDEARSKKLWKKVRALARRKERLAAGLALNLVPGKGTARGQVAKSALYPPREYVEALLDATKLLDEPDAAPEVGGLGTRGSGPDTAPSSPSP